MVEFHKIILIDPTTLQPVSVVSSTTSGLLTDRPAFGVSGRAYFATDVNGGQLYLDTGAAWIRIARSLYRPFASKSADFLVAVTDSDTVYRITAADKVATLPATAAGVEVTFMLAAGGLSAGTGFQIAPNAADKIMGNGLTSADNKALILSGATDREGDSVTLLGDGVDGWYITAITGTWARAA